MVRLVAALGKEHCFAPTPWTKDSPQWQGLDDRLPLDHLARQVDEVVAMLDLTPLLASYLGVGKRALRPDLLLKMVLYEIQSNRPSPAQWARDVRESEPVRWLLMGMEPSRARLYDFRDRIAPFLAAWNAQVLNRAVAEQMTSAQRAALDGTSVAAHASRRKLLNAERLQKRRTLLAKALRRATRGEANVDPPAWLAKTEVGLRRQQHRYTRAAEVMRGRQAANAQRPSGKRKPAEKILVSPTDPDAVPARDKLNVFRPLYNVQLLRDLDTPLILAYDVMLQNNDNGALPRMVERMIDTLGCQPIELLADAGYVSVRDLEFCATVGITLYGPCQENDYSQKNGKKKQSNQHTELPKSSFLWLADEQAYQCPQGHRLSFTKTQTQRRADYSVKLHFYTCDPTHCLACSRQADCTTAPHKGRTVSRIENEHLLDELRQRMQQDEVKQLYKRRSQTVELNYADLKEHRGLRRFHGRGTSRANAEVAALVLIHNLLALDKYRHTARPPPQITKCPQTSCPA